MPYKYTYVEPEVVWFNKEFSIYKTYDDNDYDNPFEYWFTLDKELNRHMK